MNYEIDVGFIVNYKEEGKSTESDYLYVSPSRVGDNSEKMKAVVSIVGDLQESETIPQLTHQVLLKPNTLTTNDQFAFTQMNYWLLVHRDMITFDGSE